jgi:hypothetical protein
MTWKQSIGLALAAVMGVGLAGCAGDEAAISAPAAKPIPKNIEESPQLSAEAGVPLPEVSDPGFTETRALVDSRTFATRGDAFALMGPEAQFDRDQRSERIVLQTGGFSVEWEPPEEKPDPEERREPQPYRRLAGILLGDAVMALIEWEDGRTYQVRPGQAVAGSEWVVFTIDSEKAILRRKGDVLPREVVVPLESRRGGGGRGGGNQGGGGGLAPGGGGAAGGGAPTPGLSGASPGGSGGGAGTSRND